MSGSRTPEKDNKNSLPPRFRTPTPISRNLISRETLPIVKKRKREFSSFACENSFTANMNSLITNKGKRIKSDKEFDN